MVKKNLWKCHKLKRYTGTFVGISFRKLKIVKSGLEVVFSS